MLLFATGSRILRPARSGCWVLNTSDCAGAGRGSLGDRQARAKQTKLYPHRESFPFAHVLIFPRSKSGVRHVAPARSLVNSPPTQPFPFSLFSVIEPPWVSAPYLSSPAGRHPGPAECDERRPVQRQYGLIQRPPKAGENIRYFDVDYG